MDTKPYKNLLFFRGVFPQNLKLQLKYAMLKKEENKKTHAVHRYAFVRPKTLKSSKNTETHFATNCAINEQPTRKKIKLT